MRRRSDAGMWDELESARHGDLVRFETSSRSPASTYLVLSIGHVSDYCWDERISASDGFFRLLGRRGGIYFVSYERTWPGPGLETWLYGTSTDGCPRGRTRLTAFEVTDEELDPHEFFGYHMAEAWPHV